MVGALLAELEMLRARVQREDEVHSHEVGADVVLRLQGQLDAAEVGTEEAMVECEGKLTAVEADARLWALTPSCSSDPQCRHPAQTAAQMLPHASRFKARQQVGVVMILRVI